jgi:small subunit ribosomal protein S9
MYEQKHFATGKRKTAIARVRMEPGEGKFVVNDKQLEDYFAGMSAQIASIKQPLEMTDTAGKYDIYAKVMGGGMTGQADAVRHGIAKTLLAIDPAVRAVLKRASMLTRDSRKKERKKYGQKGARKKFQYSKR